MPKKKFFFILTRRNILCIILSTGIILITVLTGTLLLTHLTSNPLESKCVIIDPGHGGIDGGTNDGAEFLEKEINLQIAKRLQEMLASNNISVSLSRDSDVSLDGLQDKLSAERHIRDLIARVVMFNSGKYDIFVSIHVNYCDDSSAIGPTVFYSPHINESGQLAEAIQDRLNRHMKSVYDIDSKRNPVKSDLFILKNSNIPGVIIETGFISNPVEKRLLKDDSYQTKLAKSIYQGLQDYIKNIRMASINGNDNQFQSNLDSLE